ncbi:hypothetical protein [uncultured Sphingomonas sp.]|uniref:hypothetical protein n=1 Tax=uncultured Sphingomonas sp. TaxID=158754 RepID=UPI002599C017|nr:hypothetical protein [uncultured Sphingomonas sp.]
MGLAATHRLTQLEGGLSVLTCETLERGAKEECHALGYECLVEKGFGRGLIVADEVREILDLLGQGEVDGVLPEFAGVADGLQHSTSPVLASLDERYEFPEMLRPVAKQRKKAIRQIVRPS